MLKATFCNTQKIWWNLSLAHYRGDEVPLIDTGFEICHVCFASCSPLKSNFKALFSSRNRMRALSDAILLLAGRCHFLHGQSRATTYNVLGTCFQNIVNRPQTARWVSQAHGTLDSLQRCPACRLLVSPSSLSVSQLATCMPLHQPLIVMEFCVVNDSGSSRWVQKRLPFVDTYNLQIEFTWISVHVVSLKSHSLPSYVVITTYTTRFHIKQVRTRPQYATLTARLHHLMSRDVRFLNILQKTKFFLKHAPYLRNICTSRYRNKGDLQSVSHGQYSGFAIDHARCSSLLQAQRAPHGKNSFSQ